MGDAAHALLPMTGQGANSAIADAICLATRLSQVRVSNQLENSCATFVVALLIIYLPLLMVPSLYCFMLQ